MTKDTNVVIFLVVCLCCPSANVTSHRTVDSYRFWLLYKKTYWFLLLLLFTFYYAASLLEFFSPFYICAFPLSSW